jgi:SapC
MYKNVEAINQVAHKNKSLKELKDFSLTREMISVPVSFNEFYEACRDYPIFFAKDAQGEWFATALLGVNNKNLYLDENGQWKKGAYIPAFFRRYPFILVKSDENNEESLTLAIDARTLEDTNESNKARAFFNDNNTPTEFAKGAMNFLLELDNSAKATSELIKDLDEWELLIEQSAHIVDAEGDTHTINGFFTVNEEKLNHLSDKKKQDICKKGAIPLITAHLISLGNIRRMGGVSL